MKRFVYVTILCLVGFVALFAGPLSSIALALSQGPQSPQNGVQFNLNWVNECAISGTITDTANGSSKTTNVNLVDSHCVQNWDQNYNTKLISLFSDNSTCLPSSPSTLQANAYKPGTAITSGTLYYLEAGVSTPCVGYNLSSSKSITIGNTGNANIVYALSGTTISRVDNNPYYTFNQSSTNPNLYVMQTGSCSDRILINGNNSGTLWELSNPSSSSSSAWPSSHVPSPSVEASGCFVSYAVDDVNGPTATGQADSSNICFSKSYSSTNDYQLNEAGHCSEHLQNSDGSFSLNIGGATNQTPGSGNGANNPNGTQAGSGTCESSGLSLAWIVCGAIDLISKAESSIESLIGSLLQTQPFNFSGSSNCTGSGASCNNQKVDTAIYGVWSNFRTYGDILLVIALLVIVISEAAGGGVIDTYTARKVLPRILAAAILINLSIYLVAALEDVFNILGSGIIAIIEAPFKSSASSLTSAIQLSPSGSVAFTLGLTTLVALPIAISGFVGILFLVILMALLAAIGVLVTITIRQGLLVFLLMVSPIAFALYVLPNTERYFKQWWSLLLKTLAVYPIVMAVFGISFVSGVIMSNLSNGNDQVISQTMALLAVVAPIFLIPFAFRLSGGVIGAVQNGVSKFASRVNKPLQRTAVRQAGIGFNKTLTGNRFAGGNVSNRRGRFNKGLQRVAVLGSGKAGINIFNPRGMNSRATSVISASVPAEMAELEKDGIYQNWNSDDEIARAATESVDEAGFRSNLRQVDAKRVLAGGTARWTDAELNKSSADVENVRRRFGAKAFQASTYLHSVAGGTAYDGETGGGDMATNLVNAAGGDNNLLRSLVAGTKQSTTQAGRGEYNASFGTWLGAAEDMRRAVRSPGGVTEKVRGDVDKMLRASAAESLGVGEAERVKPQAAAHLAETHATNIKKIIDEIGTADTPEKMEVAQTKLDEELASTMGLADYLSAAPPNVAKAYREKLLAETIVDPGSGQKYSIYDVATNPARSSRPAFVQMRGAYAQRLAQQQSMSGMGSMPSSVPGAPEPPAPPPTNP